MEPPLPSPSPVRLAVYDVSGGWAGWLSPVLFCRRIRIAPHTGILLFGHEYFWSGGLKKMTHEEFMHSWRIRPVEIVELGYTQIPEDLFQDFILNVTSQYTTDSYSVLSRNCNAFTEQCSQFLLGHGIPEYITEAPEAVKSSPLGKCLFGIAALAPSTRHLGLLLLQLLIAVSGITSLQLIPTATSETSCPTAGDSTIRFALFGFAIDSAYTVSLIVCLFLAYISRRVCCLLPPIVELFIGLLLGLMAYAVAVSMKTLQSTLGRLQPDECAGPAAHLGVACALSWILLLFGMLPRCLLSHQAVMSSMLEAPRQDADGSRQELIGASVSLASP